MTPPHEMCEEDKNIERVLARARNVFIGIGASCLALYTETPSAFLMSNGRFFTLVAGGLLEGCRLGHVYFANQYATEEAQRQTAELAESVNAVFEAIGTPTVAQSVILATVGSE